MREPLEIGLTFDDVLLIPRRSGGSTRRQGETVTEAPMASAIAREGGIGIIHRFLPIDEHVAEVRRVKRAESVVIDAPYTVGPEATVGHPGAFMEGDGWG